MSIAALAARGKALLDGVPKDALLLGVALLACLASFGFGYLEGRDEAHGETGAQGGAISIELAPSAAQTANLAQDPRESREQPAPPASAAMQVIAAPAGQGSGVYVASKNGTKYYLPTCSGAKRISDKNKVWFDTAAAATAAGYGPAANCKGL